MTQTEKLLNSAEDIARRSFESPTQETVMQLFARLCDEADLMPQPYEDESVSDVLH